MAETGVKIDLIVANFSMQNKDESRIRKFCENVWFYRGKSSSRSKLLWLLSQAMKLSFKKYDALYTNGQGESIGLLAKLIFRRKIWVHHHHTSGDQADQDTWGKNYRKTLTSANVVIACSTRNAKDIATVLGRKIDVIPCFSRQISPFKIDRKNGKLQFGYYGRLIPEKGIDILCKLSEDDEVDSIDFNLWGEGENYPPSYFKAFPKINFHGKFNGKEELSKVISSLDGFLLISTHPEGLPISLLEAMSAGLPWLATDRGGIVDIACDPNSTRVISPGSDYLEIKKAVMSFAYDIQLGKISRESQMELYSKRFSSTALVKEWSKALQLF
jgi:glycosyltransferase involved in cell wall biosynthesis